MPARWFIYALGGGWGHFQRAVALARAAAARGHAVEVLVNSPWAGAVLSQEIAPLIALSPAISFQLLSSTLPFEETRRTVRRIVAESAPDVLVVDTFPRGLGGELVDLLPEISSPCVWIHRAIRPDYVAEMKLAEFAEHYHLILLPGEEAALAAHPRAVRTAPWLLCEATELLSREAARRQLRVESELPVVLVPAAGRPEEVAGDRQLATRLAEELRGRAEVRLALFSAMRPQSTELQTIAAWPLLAVLPGVDIVVGAGGYHTVHEARAVGVPLLAQARPRKYDQQELRLRHDESAANDDELIARIKERLGTLPQRGAPAYENGVHSAVDAIEVLLPR